jgi:hypothetical protein
VDTAGADLLSQALNKLLAVTSPDNITFPPEWTAEDTNLLRGLEHNVACHLDYDEQNTQREETMSSLLPGYRRTDETSKPNTLFSTEVTDTGSTSTDTLTMPKALIQKYRRSMRYTKMKAKIIEELGCMDTQRHTFSDPLAVHHTRYNNYVPTQSSIQVDIHRIYSKKKPSNMNLQSYSQSDSFVEHHRTSTPGDCMNEMLNQHEAGELTTMLGNMSSHAKQLTSHLTDATQELYKAHEDIQVLHKRQTLLTADLMSNTVSPLSPSHD